METGRIELDRRGPFDLQATLESGQSYLWWREDGQEYEADRLHGGDSWYATTTRVTGTPAPVRVRQRDGDLEWESTVEAAPIIERRLGLGDDLAAIRAATTDEELVETAYDRYWGLRIVRDPPFPALISFICSAQMRVSRIHTMQQALREEFGPAVTLNGRRYNAYPTPKTLAGATESTLRELSLGYRAPYVARTAAMVVDDEPPEAVHGTPYEQARETLTQYVGVGEKVADCVLLFSLGYLQAVPLDTWMQSVIESEYPGCDEGSYADTSRAFRARLGGRYAGYAQTYLFHYLRREDPL
jgi:3-methyladenine DNA glycosylase/8-oxoguanine DNA glycosylase